MSVLVFAESVDGKFRKSCFEAVSFAAAVSKQLNLPLAAISIGEVDASELEKLGKYGASKVLSCTDARVRSFNVQPYASVVSSAARAEQAQVVILSASFSGKGLAPRIAVKLQAGLGDNVVDLPETSGTFVVKKNAYSGKAFARVEILSPVKVLSLVPNSYKVVEHPVPVTVSAFEAAFGDKDFVLEVKETVRATDKVSLPDAELVVSAGRGMKGPENWGMVEELATVLGAATACSKPVSDAGWRPHSEHVGQTGIAISPNLYIAIGISGAIQHLAGVSSSKVIVVVNKDPEAPFFKAADYGILGDAFEIVPRLIEGAKAFKAAHH